MAAGKKAGMPSFNDFIQADRKRRKNEELANEILGSKNRRASAPGAGVTNNRRAPTVPSLASRVGVNKRSVSTSKPASGNKLQSRITQLQRTKSLSNLDRPAPSQRDATGGQNGFGIKNGPSNGAEGIHIKGAAGPSIVVASNFAPGTTAADIEAVMVPVGGEVQYCKIVAAKPTVIAEMAFLDKAGAENVIAMFNNKRADGRLLYVYMKQGAPHQFANSQPESYNDDMEVDQNNRGGNRPPTGPRRAEPQYQDGRYGFSDSSASQNQRRGRDIPEEPRLMSDRMIRQNGRFRR